MVIHGSAEVIARIGFGVAEEAVQRDETGFVAVHIEAEFVIVLRVGRWRRDPALFQA